jgi:methionyl-tRNA formyltransferase
VTLFQIDEGLDTGPIWGQVPTQINPGENSFDLLKRLTQFGVSLLLEKLPLITAGFDKPTIQAVADSNHRLAKKLVRSEAEIKWNQPAGLIERQVRAFNPEPVAFTQLQGQPFRILRARASEKKILESSAEGSIVIDAKNVYVVCAGQTCLELLEVQPNGKKPMAAKDWANGLKVDKLG